ncbi:hypothetical protein FACS1894159_08910 [Bacteroidia bacterium]|nr:hypothetical protein FACS1894159_08910 [Bacteroidia bacterium]
MNPKRKRRILRILLVAVASLAMAVVILRCSNARAHRNSLPTLHDRATEALGFCRAQGLNTDYCILVDFGIHSGRNRLFVWDFARDTIFCSSLCAHGYGMSSTTSVPVFSNEPGSYCSSQGRYRIGARSYSKWGINIHYKLHGLDATNDNAFRRYVVLHSYGPVPETEIFPLHLPLGYSQGCPVVSNEVMRRIDTLLQKASPPLLLWIYR